MSGSFSCSECSLKFPTQEYLDNHKRRFCTGSIFADPDRLRDSLLGPGAAQPAGLHSPQASVSPTASNQAVTLDELRSYISGPRTDPYVGSLTIAQLKQRIQNDDAEMEKLQRLAEQEIREKRANAVAKVKAKQESLSSSQREKERALLAMLDELESRKEQEMKIRMEMERTKAALEHAERQQLTTLGEEKRAELRNLQRERELLLAKENEVANQLSELQNKLVDKQQKGASSPQVSVTSPASEQQKMWMDYAERQAERRIASKQLEADRSDIDARLQRVSFESSKSVPTKKSASFGNDDSLDQFVGSVRDQETAAEKRILDMRKRIAEQEQRDKEILDSLSVPAMTSSQSQPEIDELDQLLLKFPLSARNSRPNSAGNITQEPVPLRPPSQQNQMNGSLPQSPMAPTRDSRSGSLTGTAPTPLPSTKEVRSSSISGPTPPLQARESRADVRSKAFHQPQPAQSQYPMHAAPHEVVLVENLLKQVEATQSLIEKHEEENRRLEEHLLKIEQLQEERKRERLEELEREREREKHEREERKQREEKSKPMEEQLDAMRKEHATEMAKLDFEMEKLAKEGRLAKIKADLEKQQAEEDKKRKHEQWLEEQKKQILEARLKKQLSSADNASAPVYDAEAGFVVFFDAMTSTMSAPSRLVTFAYAVYVGNSLRTAVRALPAVSSTSAGSDNKIVVGHKRRFAKVEANTETRIIIEVQSVEKEGQTGKSMGWTVLPVFSDRLDLSQGKWKLPCMVPPVAIGNVRSDGISGSRVPIDVFVRIERPDEVNTGPNAPVFTENDSVGTYRLPYLSDIEPPVRSQKDGPLPRKQSMVPPISQKADEEVEVLDAEPPPAKQPSARQLQPQQQSETPSQQAEPQTPQPDRVSEIDTARSPPVQPDKQVSASSEQPALPGAAQETEPQSPPPPPAAANPAAAAAPAPAPESRSLKPESEAKANVKKNDIINVAVVGANNLPGNVSLSKVVIAFPASPKLFFEGPCRADGTVRNPRYDLAVPIKVKDLNAKDSIMEIGIEAVDRNTLEHVQVGVASIALFRAADCVIEGTYILPLMRSLSRSLCGATVTITVNRPDAACVNKCLPYTDNDLQAMAFSSSSKDLAVREVASSMFKSPPSDEASIHSVIMNVLKRNRSTRIRPIDISYLAAYDPQVGFAVAVDGAVNLPQKEAVVKCTVSIWPTSQSKSWVVAKNDMETDARNPTFSTPMKKLTDVTAHANLAVVVEVFGCIRFTEPLLFQPLGFAILPVLNDNNVVRCGTHQCPLYLGRAPDDLRQELLTDGALLEDIVEKRLQDRKFKYLNFASVFVRIEDGHLEGEIGQMDLLRRDALPSQYADRFAKQGTGSKMSVLRPKKVSPEEFEDKANRAVSLLSGVAYEAPVVIPSI